jgi:hypothetical protein
MLRMYEIPLVYVSVLPVYGEHYEYLIALCFAYIPLPGSHHKYLIALYPLHGRNSPCIRVCVACVYGEHYEYLIAPVSPIYPSQVAIVDI